MSHTFRRSFVAFALGLALAAPVHAQSVAPKSINPGLIVFGDSLSDGGAGIALADALCRNPLVGALTCGKRRDAVRLGAPYFEGRSFSDGPVAVDVMARLFGKALTPGYRNPLVPTISRVGQNYAIAGAHAAGSGADAMVSLEGQIGAYAHHYQRANADTLHVILIGGNDLAAAIPTNDKAAVTRAVAAIQAGVQRLASMGARRILVYKLLPMQDVPRFAAQPALKGNAAALTAQFNAGIDALRAPTGVTLLRFDMSPMWSLVKQQTWRSGKDYKTACAAGVRDVISQVKQNPATNVVVTAPWLPACAPARRDHRAFLDDLHPSGYLHQMLGQATYDFVFESLNGGQCAVHGWGSETLPSRGQPAMRRGLLGTVHRYDNPYSRQREYFRLVDADNNDGAYGPYPIDRRDNPYWEYIGTTPPKHCGTAFRAAMNLWQARLPSGGVATGDFPRAKRGDRFAWFNPSIRQVEYFTFLDPQRSGAFWYFPTDGVSNNPWWLRTKFD